MKFVKLLFACIASVSIFGFLGNDSLVLEARLFRCIISCALAIYFFSSFFSDNRNETKINDSQTDNETTLHDELNEESHTKYINDINYQRSKIALQIAEQIKIICKKSIEKDTLDKYKSKISLDDEFNEYYKSTLIVIPSQDDIEEQPFTNHFIFENDSRESFDDLWKDAPPINVYKDAYTSRKSKLYPSNYVVFDTETTGLEFRIQRIIEIGAIKYIDHEPVDKFQILIDPEIELDDFITDLTGITNDDLRGKPTIDMVLPYFFDFIGDFTLVAHNAPFDIKMLACEAYRCGIKLVDNKIIDTVTLAKRCIPKTKVENYKLSTLKDYFGLAYGSHRALEDCEVCSAIYQFYCNSIRHK